MQDRRKIYVVDDHPVVQQGLALLFEAAGDLCVCGSAANGPEALRGIAEAEPDLILMDLRLGHDSGVALIKECRQRFPDLPIVVLSMHDDALHAARAVRAGAQGYVTKGQPTELLLDTIRQGLAGRLTPPEVIGDLPKERSGAKPSKFTTREQQVFELLGHGLSTRTIATELNVSIKTVETYRHNIKKKLGLRDASELIHHATLWVERRESKH